MNLNIEQKRLVLLLTEIAISNSLLEKYGEENSAVWELMDQLQEREMSLEQYRESRAEFAMQALVAAGIVSQTKVDEAMALPGAPQPADAADGRLLGSMQAELAGAESANLHLSAMIDELRWLLARAMLAMKQLHGAAEPDETREGCPPIISAEAFARFVDQNAALLHAIHISCHDLPAPPSQDASKEQS